jgi:hypothetical protein
MLTKTIKCVSVGILLLAGILWHYAANDQLLFDFIVCAGGILAVHYAMRARKRLLAWELLGVALLFNPVVPIFMPAGNLSLVAVWISVVLIVTSLIAFKAQPLPSIPSITNLNQGSKSL